MKVEIQGLEMSKKLLDSMPQRVQGIAIGALFHEAQYELGLTQDQVPVGLGNLKASGRLGDLEFSEGAVTVPIMYGGPAGSGARQAEDVDYALYVHEDLEAEHANGKAKYVEDPVRQEMEGGGAAKRMGAEIREKLALSALQGTLMASGTQKPGMEDASKKANIDVGVARGGTQESGGAMR